MIDKFIESLNVIPLVSCFDIYAKEKVRLRNEGNIEGNIIDEFDLLIGCTAIANDMILVTNNERHFERLQNIRIENWVVIPTIFHIVGISNYNGFVIRYAIRSYSTPAF